MELKIKEITFPEVIEFNFDELKKEITGKVEIYKNLVYSEEQIKEAKSDRASLKKFVKALSDERIKVKKQCLQPYEEFEAKVNELSAIVNEPINLIDKQVKEYEEQQKKEKEATILKYWEAQVDEGAVPEGLVLEEIFDNRWLNASTSMKSIQDAITTAIEKFNADMETLSKMPEFGFEAQQIYISSLDINKAIAEGHRLSEIQKKKAEYEAEQARLKAEEEARKAAEEVALSTIGKTVEAIEKAGLEVAISKMETVEPSKQWVSFQAYLTVNQAHELKQFFDDRQIEFKAVK